VTKRRPGRMVTGNKRSSSSGTEAISAALIRACDVTLAVLYESETEASNDCCEARVVL
jgi:hypothetical protein